MNPSATTVLNGARGGNQYVSIEVSPVRQASAAWEMEVIVKRNINGKKCGEKESNG